MNFAPVGHDRERILIRTKMNRPQLPAGIIIRPRLMELLDKTLGRRITLISAPASYGKTTLAVQWLERCPSKVAWISLDADRLLRYFVASMQTALSGCSPHDFLLACARTRGNKPCKRIVKLRYSLSS